MTRERKREREKENNAYAKNPKTGFLSNILHAQWSVLVVNSCTDPVITSNDRLTARRHIIQNVEPEVIAGANVVG